MLLVTLASCQIGSQTEKPNIIVILADDAGYADFGFNGCEDLKTPNIDNLAQQGVVFSDAHVSSSVCSPSRAGIITGRYQQRYGHECNEGDGFTGLPKTEISLAKRLKTQGYNTAAFGKWHLGYAEGYHPNDRGFDYFYGFLAGGRSYFPDENNDRLGDTHAILENKKHVLFDGYLTDVLGVKASQYIEKNEGQPFFMYLAYNAVHTPMHATKEDLALFEGHSRQTLAAMTWALDRSVGNVIKTLKDKKMLDNTVIFFLSDNGGAHNNQSSNYPLNGFKGNEFEGGHRVPFLVYWKDKLKVGSYDGLSSSLDIGATACALAGVKGDFNLPLDGVNLMPYISGEKSEPPHDKLFWRKDKMAAARVGDYKLVRVQGLKSTVYDLDTDLGEKDNLAIEKPELKDQLENELKSWEEQMISPLWTEGHRWDTITYMIHEDLMLNRTVRVKDPSQLKEYKAMVKKSKMEMK
ncbi:hypothetical protein ALGA_4109 [Labilibaculum antarcticum]|uniref:Sulfatase N-terminal domain-containing protein n=2 Tax=Labilibaculum antarcticum TaxID=1717717 RepID=A0A1Y1CQ40_9BACT|nr:hypothetical protein ALGA_4109 [Labilibaculum antarcticum]